MSAHGTPPAGPAQRGAGRPPIRVVIADDAFLLRQAVRHLLERTPIVDVVGECADAATALELVDRVAADVLVTDIRMPPADDDDGIRLAIELRRTHPALGVIVLSTYAEVTYALRLFEHGADGRGYLLKDRIPDRASLLRAVTTVADGGSVIDPTIVQDLVRTHRVAGAARLQELTPRELETLALVAEGLSNAAIAERLVLTKRAVEKHVNAIFAKLDLDDPEHVSRRVMAALVYLSERPDTHVASRPPMDG